MTDPTAILVYFKCDYGTPEYAALLRALCDHFGADAVVELVECADDRNCGFDVVGHDRAAVESFVATLGGYAAEE